MWLSRGVENVPALALIISSTFALALVPTPSRENEADREAPAILQAKPLKTEVGDAELPKLLKARYNAALRLLQVHHDMYLMGKIGTQDLVNTVHRFVRAGLEIHRQPKDRTDFLQKTLLYCAYVQKSRIEAKRKDAALGQLAPQADITGWQEFTLSVEIELLRAKETTNHTPK
jgi:hypothetical protein